MSKGWIGVDLDCTLAHHAEGTGAPVPGEPIAPMVARVKRWLAAGHDVRIFTARVQLQATEVHAVRDSNHQRAIILEWCRGVFGRELPITNIKDPHMWCLFDDRAVSVSANTGNLYGMVPDELADPPRPKCRLTHWVDWCPCHGPCL